MIIKEQERVVGKLMQWRKLDVDGFSAAPLLQFMCVINQEHVRQVVLKDKITNSDGGREIVFLKWERKYHHHHHYGRKSTTSGRERCKQEPVFFKFDYHTLSGKLSCFWIISAVCLNKFIKMIFAT